ncbi:MAG: hypothetical protein R3B47_05535 [Bacteroidia bacterium]
MASFFEGGCAILQQKRYDKKQCHASNRTNNPDFNNSIASICSPLPTKLLMEPKKLFELENDCEKLLYIQQIWSEESQRQCFNDFFVYLGELTGNQPNLSYGFYGIFMIMIQFWKADMQTWARKLNCNLYPNINQDEGADFVDDDFGKPIKRRPTLTINIIENSTLKASLTGTFSVISVSSKTELTITSRDSISKIKVRGMLAD